MKREELNARCANLRVRLPRQWKLMRSRLLLQQNPKKMQCKSIPLLPRVRRNQFPPLNWAKVRGNYISTPQSKISAVLYQHAITKYGRFPTKYSILTPISPIVLTQTENVKAIEEKRQEAAKKGKQERDPAGNYKLVCPACTKPNSLTVNFCTGCSFGLSEWDEQQMSDNIFLDMINGQDIGATIRHRLFFSVPCSSFHNLIFWILIETKTLLSLTTSLVCRKTIWISSPSKL